MNDHSRPTSVNKNKIFNGQVQAHTAARWTETVGVTTFWFRWFVLERWNECHGYQIMSEIGNAYYGPISSPANVKMKREEMDKMREEWKRIYERRAEEKWWEECNSECCVWYHDLCNNIIQIPAPHVSIMSSNSHILHCWDWRNGTNSGHNFRTIYLNGISQSVTVFRQQSLG